MFNPGHSHDESAGRRWAVVAAIAGAALLLGLILIIATWRSARPPDEPSPPVASDRAPAGVAGSKDDGAPEPAPDAPPPTPTRRRPRAEPTDVAPAPEPESAPALVLRVESDVEGASVFVDRQYLGNAPVETTAIAAGSHQLNASADGYDGIARTIEVAESGPTTITLRFRDVTIDMSIDVVHKHGMGSCEGQLQAANAGFRYVTSNKGDAFVLPFAAVEQFDVDYLKKNLRIKQKGGRTWNFTEPSGDADKLFVFHRDVSKARERLAEQGRAR